MGKPRLTKAVLDGLAEAVSLAESITTDYRAEGRNTEAVQKVERAREWVNAMRRHPGAPSMSVSVLPYPKDRGGTHWDGCWREPRHHNCAVLEIDRLRAALAQRRAPAAPDAETLERAATAYIADRIAALLPPRTLAGDQPPGDDCEPDQPVPIPTPRTL